MEKIVDMEKWERKKERIFLRDGYRCQRCLKNNVELMVYIDKIGIGIPIEENRDIDMYTVCVDCYRKGL